MLVLSRLTLAGVRTAVATDGGAAMAADLASLVQSPNETFVAGCVGERRKKIQLLGFLDPWNHCPSKMTHNIQWDEVKTKNKTGGPLESRKGCWMTRIFPLQVLLSPAHLTFIINPA